MYAVKQADTEGELKKIIELRYKILRAPWQQPAETATDELEAASINAYISDEHGQVLACARLQENENKTGQVRYMAVDLPLQGKGLGRVLLNFLEDKGRKMGLVRIELQARENAVHFYQGCGYRIIEKTFLLWGIIQHYRMEKDLAKAPR